MTHTPNQIAKPCSNCLHPAQARKTLQSLKITGVQFGKPEPPQPHKPETLTPKARKSPCGAFRTVAHHRAADENFLSWHLGSIAHSAARLHKGAVNNCK